MASALGYILAVLSCQAFWGLASDVCSNDFQSPLSALCPVDTSTSTGICPDMRANDECSPGDMCASSATASLQCPTDGNSGSSDADSQDGGSGQIYQCPEFPPGATCSAFTGECSSPQICNARVPEAASDQHHCSTTGLCSTTAGVCVTPKAAGSACTAGYDLCSGYADGDYAGQFCTGSTCPVARPGSSCGAADRCAADTSGTTAACPDDGVCPQLPADASCLAGDSCANSQLCNAIGSATGTCVYPISAGSICSSTTPDVCLTNQQDDSGTICASGKCPLRSAGSQCASGDLCSSGTDVGVACPGNDICPTLGPDAACLVGDGCIAPWQSSQYTYSQACNAVGTSAGLCVNLTAAGDLCTPDYDVCSPGNTLCSSGTCPLADAGSLCNVGDMCSSGTKGGSLCSETYDQDDEFCPPLTTGLACTASDACVNGAVCVGAKNDGSASGICTPFLKGAATPPSPHGQTAQASANSTKGRVFSDAVTVPAVTSVATLSMYSDANAFNTSERARFISTLEANIFAKIDAIVNVSITKVVTGSAVVTNSVAFTGADSNAASAEQTALYQTLASGDTTIFGTSFGSVVVSNITQGNTTNPTVTNRATSAGVTVWIMGAAFLVAIMAGNI